MKGSYYDYTGFDDWWNKRKRRRLWRLVARISKWIILIAIWVVILFVARNLMYWRFGW